jgi:predicted GH43/DUF377 family glycosyl hydrolase
MTTLLLLLLLFFHPALKATLTDLEKRAQDFVLETRQLHIPGFPHAFNPSIIRWNGELLLSFKIIPNPAASFHSYIGVIWLDENFNPVGKPQILTTRDPSSPIPSRADDARLMLAHDQLYLIYSDCPEPKISPKGFRMYIAELHYTREGFFVGKPEGLLHFEGESEKKREKNWVPFDYQDHLYLAYSLVPHRILEPMLGTQSCEEVCTSHSQIQWKWGELRGGSSALLQGDQYLAFFHSSIDTATVHSDGKKISHYFMGAYTFAKDPPFAITAISPEPIIGPRFYHGEIYKPYWKPVRVVFPYGYVSDEKYLWVAYGRQDHEIWIAKLDREGLMKSLLPVSVVKKVFENCFPSR